MNIPSRLLRWLIPLAPLPVLLLAAGCSKNAATAGAAPAVPVQVAKAVRQDVPRRIESIGNVQALRSVTVKSQVDGIIAQVNFKEGDDVRAGDLLVTLDRRPFENGLLAARADLANARAMAGQAQADLDRYQRLNDQAAISKEEYVQYATKAETSRAQVQAREAAVANAELQLGYTEIRATFAGRAGQLLLHEGALVKANDINTSIVTINQLAPIAVAYTVPETALAAIRTAQAEKRAGISITERTTHLVRTDGRLDFIDNTVDATTGTITLKALFDNADHALWPGQFVHVMTEVDIDRGVVVVPTTAVQNSQEGSTLFVVKDDKTVELRQVKVARTDGDHTLLAEGVRDGETVVTDGQLRLLPGVKVEFATLGAAAPAPAAATED
ncbi:efflux RND transporter periplasmic adaptor subunit [Opitutus sp. GAS368]|jgi:multidrug efflux system membrane fusion protein|uniref:efflux RND transporter periplasmic adaptor subunit n=1 Tax=Opitutus sp. GAS368 TaxID=1882749 RepID=UPI00087A1A56|nr:efflux RND transporter periplasmic adaptor subunit [Opitutus sp. GAS368]SDS01852.1 membrane fusion protein, multidrug efflux system [Opitutus sp. GAS368]